MAFRALLFSKSEETNAALTTACQDAGIRLEVCGDIFAAIKKGTQQVFSCVLADWSDQPEAGFLLKRARESGPNKSLVAIAIVNHEPTAAEMRDHRLDFLIYRPIAAEEARDVLAKASEKMQPVSPGDMADMPKAGEQSVDATVGSVAAQASEQNQDQPQPSATGAGDGSTGDGSDGAESEVDEREPHARLHAFTFHHACAALLVIAAALFLWMARDALVYLARTPEGGVTVLKESVSALFYVNSSDGMPSHAARPGAHDGDSSPSVAASTAQTVQVGVVEAEADLNRSRIPLRKAADFPLPTPVFESAQPVRARGAVPESLRGSPPITRPVVVTVNPAQMMPVTMPAVPPTSTQSFSEPVLVSEEAERTLLMQSVEPAYPPAALAQKLHGPVVLQAIIGREGNVEDLKIIRGNFVLAKAAIAAVKQWRFHPYMVNGRAAQTQTLITVNFGDPPS